MIKNWPSFKMVAKKHSERQGFFYGSYWRKGVVINVLHPFPSSTFSWEKLARRNGLVNTQLLATVPSRFLGQIYSAISFWPE